MFRISLNSLWSHKRRLIATSLSVLLGVAFMSGTLVLTSTINRVFDDLFANTNQNTSAIVRGPVLFKDERQGTKRDRIPENAVANVRKVEGVANAVPVAFTQDVTLLSPDGDPLGGNGPPTFVGSWSPDPKLNDYRISEGRAPQAVGEAVLDTATADASDFVLGKPITVVTAKGNQQLTLVGLTKFGDADSAAGVIAIFTTLPQAQAIIGEPDKIDQVDVRDDGTISDDQLVQRLDDAKVAKKADVLTGRAAADEQANEIKDAFGFFSQILLVFAFIALFVGAFIISNTFSILVAQRTRELALMRAIGASRRQVLASVLLEAGLIGVISAVVGFVVGVGLAAFGLFILKAVGLDLPTAGIALAPGSALAAILVGLVLTTVAAVIPAVRATRVPPLAALRDMAIDQSGRSKVRAVLGLLLLALGVVSVLPAFGTDPSTDVLPGVGIGLGLLVLAVLTLGPTLARPLSAAVGAPLPLLLGITGRLSRQNAMRNPRRTASTAAAIIIGVTLITFITIFASSAQRSVTAAIDGGFNGDFIIQPASQQSTFGAPPELAASLAKIPGVATVASVTFLPAEIELPNGDKAQTFIGGADPRSYQQLFDVKMAEGEITDLKAGGIVVDQQTAKEMDLKVGDTVKVLSAAGRKAGFRVAAVTDDVLLAGWTVTKVDADKLTPTPSDRLVAVKLRSGTTVDEIRPALRKEVRKYPTIKLQDRDQFTGSIVKQISALLNVIYVLLLVSVVIALVGIANTLSLSTHERTRELGLMRATGMMRSQLRALVRWEAAVVAVIGTTIGLVLGIGLSWVMVKALAGQGITDYSVPVFKFFLLFGFIPGLGGMIGIGIGALILGVLASLWPAFKASKLNVLRAIATE